MPGWTVSKALEPPWALPSAARGMQAAVLVLARFAAIYMCDSPRCRGPHRRLHCPNRSQASPFRNNEHDSTDYLSITIIIASYLVRSGFLGTSVLS